MDLPGISFSASNGKKIIAATSITAGMNNQIKYVRKMRIIKN
jgi:hypothetical protein